MGFKGISWSISGNIFRVIACTNVCFVHCSYLSKCRYCRRTFDFLKEISLPLLCSTMQWEFTLSSQIEILSWERNGSLKIRGHEGSDFKLFQELCLTRSKVETFKILRLFGVKKKTLVSGVKTLQRWRLPSTQHIWSTTAQRGSCSFQVWLVIQLQSTKKDNSTCREVLMIYCEYSSNAIIVKLIYN